MLHNLYFIIDEQLPIKFAIKLREIGIKANHVFELGLSGSSDYELAQKAISENAILISKDDDFANKANLGKLEIKLIWIRFGNVSNKILWRKFYPLIPNIIKLIEDGEILIEIV